MIQNKYRVGIYIRLSKEDGFKKEESLSVTNQKNILENYVRENNYELYDIYVDDGFTGTNFDRPSFNRLINDIELGNINMVVTKDLSRLGRDYIKTGEYIEKYFPMHNVRYVSLLDGIDTMVSNSNNDMAPFKAVINDMYSRDNSKKIRTALKTMQLKGKWVGGCPPFGYMVDSNDKNHLVINPEEAKIVKCIFEYAKRGMTYYKIAERLTVENISTPSILRNDNRMGKMSILGVWSTKTVKGILSNQIYLGDMVQNKNSRISYKIRKNIKNSKDNWIIVPNTHEPIIDRDTFFDIQKILSNSKVRNKKNIYRSLDGLLYCYECGHKISICSPNKKGYTYIVCNHYRMHSKLCTSHCFNYDTLEKIIIDRLRSIFKEQLSYNKIFKSINDYYNNISLKTRRNNKRLIDIKEKQLDDIYLDKLDGKITDEMYVRIKKRIISDIDNLKCEDIENKDSFNAEIIKDFLNLNMVSRFIMIYLINRIEIHRDKSIDIYLNFGNFN